MNEKEAIEKYYQLIEEWKKSQPHGLYNDLIIKEHYANVRMPDGGWKYQRHHICEIDISGADIQYTTLSNSEAMIVNLEQHCLLHYLIVVSQRTRPNHGMIKAFHYTGFVGWDNYVKEACEKYKVDYIPDWKKLLN